MRILIPVVVLFVAACAGASVRNEAAGPSARTSIGPQRATGTEPLRLGENRAPVERLAGASSTIRRADLLTVLDAGIPRFLQSVETEPALEAGRFVGFRLVAFFPRDDRFRGVDLRNGDVVTRVNGMSIERPEHAYRVWQELRVASELRVEYLRDRSAHEIRYAILDG